jgi:hypothetical protein
MSLARCLVTSDARKARDLWAGDDHGIRIEHGRLLNFGMGLMALGLVLVAVVIAVLLLT